MTRGGGRGGTAGGGRNNVGFVKPQEPKFLREIKEKVWYGLEFSCNNFHSKVGYREPEGIEAKMRRSEGGKEREDGEDEAPTVVVLNKGDLTEEEVTPKIQTTPVHTTCRHHSHLSTGKGRN